MAKSIDDKITDVINSLRLVKLNRQELQFHSHMGAMERTQMKVNVVKCMGDADKVFAEVKREMQNPFGVDKK
jgi:hypothetical protein